MFLKNKCNLEIYFLVFILMVSGIYSKTINTKDIELESGELESKEKPDISPELARALQPTEQAILDFITKLVNTGYISSKISLRRIEKSTDKRRALGEEITEFLEQLPKFAGEVELE